MLFNTYILLGIVFFLLVKDYFPIGSNILFFALVLLGSILPDIDSPNSKINRWSGIIGKVVTFFFKHRGFFHSLLFFGILFFIVQHFWNGYYAFGILLGNIAHLIGDGITPAGVKIFYPFSNFKIRGPIRTGGMFEWVILFSLIVLVVKDLVS
jgi:inner membrane protein